MKKVTVTNNDHELVAEISKDTIYVDCYNIKRTIKQLSKILEYLKSIDSIECNLFDEK